MHSATSLLEPPVAVARPRRRRLAGARFSADRDWGRILLVALLGLTALAYLWNLTASGYANGFYAAAVQAGTKSWKALFFGSLDASNFITVDKPPASLWVMALSGRIFGFSSASMLVPQALEGVAAVWLLHSAVKRWFGSAAGLTAGALFALTPVAALMFRFNNPDALLVLLLVAAAYCLTRALERAGTRWILACGALVGFAFLAKMLQAFLVLPAFSLVYLVAAPATLRRRLVQLLAGGAAMVAAGGWWVAIVALWPAGSRPFIDGSPSNSILNLITGYNGLQRLFSSGGGPAGAGRGGVGGASFSGATGVLRLFNSAMGGQASWLLPAALLALVAGLWSRRGRPRTDRARAALLLWGGWLIVTAIVFSFGQGVIHTYYAVALAPAIAAVVAIGGALLWRRREAAAARGLAAVALGGSAAWAYVLLDRTPSWHPWLRVAVVVGGGLAVAGLMLAGVPRRLRTAAIVLGCLAALAGPAAYAAQTIGTTHTGSLPSAGPSTPGAGLGGGFGGFGGAPPSTGGARLTGGPPRASTGRPPGTSAAASGRAGAVANQPSGGPGGNVRTSAALVRELRRDASRYRWVAATSGSSNAASLELATGEPVMAIGGFSGNGGNLSLAAFERYVAQGRIHYWIAGGGMGGSSAIASWVAAHFTATTVGGETIYDLS